MLFLDKYKPFYKRNLTLAIPVMIAQAGQVTVQFADNIMVGHLGTAQFAGVAFANTIFLIGMVFSICFTQGLTPHAGQNFGKRRYREVASYFFNSAAIDLIMVMIVMLLLYISSLFMYNMGQDEDIVEYAIIYLNINIISLIPFILFFAIRNFSEAIGITKYSMYITISANIINIVLNWVLIYGKLGFSSYGVAGAGYATLISRVMASLGFFVLIITIKPYKDYLKFFNRNFISKEKIKSLLKTSIPVGLQGLVEVTTFSLSGIMAGWFGKTALAGHQIAMTMTNTSFMIAQGIGVAATIRVSHQFGERDYVATRMAGRAATHLSIALMGFAGLLYIIFRNYLPYLFTSDVEVINIASTLLIATACFQVFDATQLSGIASLRALNDVKVPLYLSIVAYYFICLPMAYFCSVVLNMQTVGIWIGLIIGLMFAAILFFRRFSNITNRYISGVNS